MLQGTENFKSQDLGDYIFQVLLVLTVESIPTSCRSCTSNAVAPNRPAEQVIEFKYVTDTEWGFILLNHSSRPSDQYMLRRLLSQCRSPLALNRPVHLLKSATEPHAGLVPEAPMQTAAVASVSQLGWSGNGWIC